MYALFGNKHTTRQHARREGFNGVFDGYSLLVMAQATSVRMDVFSRLKELSKSHSPGFKGSSIRFSIQYSFMQQNHRGTKN